MITNVKDNQWAYFYYPESDKFIPYMINLPEFNIKTPAKSIAKIREHMSAVEKAFKTNLDAYYSVRPFDGPSVEEWNNRPKAIGKSNDKGGWFISSRNFDIYETVPDGWSVVEGASVREGYALVSNNEPFYSGKRRAGLVPLSQVQNSQGSPAAKSAGLRPQYSKNIEEAEAGELLVKPDGSPALGYIDSSAAQAINAQEGEIRANVGVVRHTENRNHKAEIESAGYDLLEYLQDVLENWEEIRQGSKGFWLVKPLHDKHNGVAVVQFVQDKNGGSYKVVTMLYSRERSIKNKKLLYTRHPVSVISPGPDVNLTPAASSASAGKQTVKGEYLSEEQSFGEILSQKIEEAKKQSEKQLDDEILLATLNAKDISEQSFIRGKNKGEYYGIQEGREYQKKIDREKLKERIAKLKQTHKLMTERQRERQKIRTRSQKIRNSLKRMRQAKNIIWARQQEINTLLDTYDLKGMSLRELQFVHEQVKELYDTGKRELAAKKLLTQERVNKMRQEIMNTMQKDWDNRPRGASRHASDTSKEYNGLRGIKNKVIDWTMAHTMSAQRFFDFLDGGKKYQGAWSKYFSDEANKAYDEELRYKFARTLDLEAFMKEHGITAKKLAETRDVNVPHQGNKGWTVDELLSVYAGMKNQKSRMAILFGNFANAENIEQAESWAADCVKALTENEKALADFIIQEYEKHFDRINNRLIDVYNQGMQHEENYTPMRRIEFTSKRDGILDPDAAENLMSSQQGSGFRSVERGFTKSRQDISEKNQKGIELGLVSMWHSQVELQEHAAAFGQLVSDLRKILMARTKNDEATVRQMVKQTRGLPAWKMIRQYFNILATSDTLNAYDALDGISKTMAKNMSVAYLCGNLGTILKQLGSFPRVLPYAGATSTLNALAQFMQNPNAFIEECYRLDPQLENRKGGDPLFRELRNGSDNLYDKALKAGYYLIGLADRAASAVVFKAVYDANIRKGLSHDDAVRQAQRVVLLTQPATHVKDKPLVWQQHGMARLAMMFTNDMAQTFGETVYDFVQSVRRGNKTEIVYRLTGLTLAAMFIKLVSSGLPDEPDDPQEWGKWITSAFVENELAAVPVIGKGLVTLWDYKRSMFGSQDPFIAPFAKLMQGVHGLWDDKNDNNERAVFNLIEGASLFAGFPSTALRRVWYASQELGHGNVLNAVKRAVGTRVENKKLKRAVSF